MRAFAVVIVIFAGVATAFRPTVPRFSTATFRPTRLYDSPKTDLVPLEKTNIENAAAVTGGIVGLAIGGPIFALILAAISNYVVKKDNDAGVALRGFGKTVIEAYNYLTTLNGKYDLTGSASNAVSKAVSSVESEDLQKVKSTVDTTVSKVSEINKEFDFVTKAKQALIAAGTLSDAALEKVEELNVKVIKITSLLSIVFTLLKLIELPTVITILCTLFYNSMISSKQPKKPPVRQLTVQEI